MTWFLVVLFAVAGGGMEVREGWYPLEQPSYEVCVESVDRVIAYLNSIDAAAVAYCRGTPNVGENI